MPIIFGLIVSLIVVLGAMVLTWREEIGLFFNGEGFRPSSYQYWIAIGLFFAIWILVSLYASTLNTVKQDYQQFLKDKKEESSPPGLPESHVSISDRDRMIAHYESLGYRHVTDLAKTPDDEEHTEFDWPIGLWATQETQYADGLYRRPGALIYGNGSVTQFSIAVIYADDVWRKGDEKLIERMGLGRATKIETAIKRPVIRELIRTNDYVMGIGLSSWIPTLEEDDNEYLAYARAFNIAYAVLRQKVIAPDRVSAVSFGHAMTQPAVPEFEPRQRSVIVIGINASRDVIVSDVLSATVDLVQVNGLRLDQYSRPYRSPLEIRSVEGEREYISIDEIRSRLVDGRQEGWVLPAVK